MMLYVGTIWKVIFEILKFILVIVWLRIGFHKLKAIREEKREIKE